MTSATTHLRLVEVSVIIPTRNRLAFLKEAVASVIAQDYRDREVVVVDDASEDGTWEWLSSLQDSGVRVLRMEQRRERSAARNLGLNHARGKYVLFLDDDDLLAAGGLSYLARALQKRPDAVAAIGARVHFDERGHCLRSSHPRVSFTRRVWSDVFFGWAPVCGQTLFRKSQLLKVGIWNEGLSIAEDHELWMRLSMEGPAAILPRLVLWVRSHAGQTSVVGFGKKQVSRIKLGHLAKVSPGMQAQGMTLHDGYRYLRVAQKAFLLQRYKTSFTCYMTAICKVPRQLWSPLTGPDLGSGLIKSVVCLVQPLAFTSFIRRLRRKLRLLLRKSPAASPGVVQSTGNSTFAG
jgi:hypothetical protein